MNHQGVRHCDPTLSLMSHEHECQQARQLLPRLKKQSSCIHAAHRGRHLQEENGQSDGGRGQHHTVANGRETGFRRQRSPEPGGLSDYGCRRVAIVVDGGHHLVPIVVGRWRLFNPRSGIAPVSLGDPLLAPSSCPRHAHGAFPRPCQSTPPIDTVRRRSRSVFHGPVPS